MLILSIGDLNGVGDVNVLYGSFSGLQTSSPADQFWQQNSPDVQDMTDGGDRFGSFAVTPALLT